MFQLTVAPGEHAGIWEVDGEDINGVVDLQPRRPPQLTFYPGKGISPAGIPGPQRDFPELRGRLYSNIEVILKDAFLQDFLGQDVGSARWAVAGLNVADVPNSRWKRIQFQVSGAELVWGNAVTAIKWPKDSKTTPEHLEVDLKPDVQESSGEGARIYCGYSSTFPLSDPYGFHVDTAPVVVIENDRGMTIDEWVERWVQPMVHLVSLSTGRTETLKWLMVRNLTEAEAERDRHAQITGQVFGAGIDQEVLRAQRITDSRGRPVLPLFTLAEAPELGELIPRWRDLAENHPELVLQRLASNPDLPVVARFLLTMQALESVHATENRIAEQEEQARYREERGKVLKVLQSITELDGDTFKFLNKNLAKDPFRSLAGRIRALIRKVPDKKRRVDDWLKRTDDLGAALAADGRKAGDFAERLSQARNVLSHGGVLPTGALAPAVNIAGALLRCELLFLLAFSSEQTGKAYDRLELLIE
jgi:hypothetical protein